MELQEAKEGLSFNKKLGWSLLVGLMLVFILFATIFLISTGADNWPILFPIP